MSKKITYIANAQVIGCLLVVFGHSYPFNVHIPSLLISLREFIYFFHMPLFVFISGYLVVKANCVKKHGSSNYIKNRSVKLLVPYLVLSLIGIIPKYLARNYINDTVELTEIINFFKVLFVPRKGIWGHLWFIPMLFIFNVLSIPFSQIMEKDRKNSCVLVIATLALLFISRLTDWFALNDIKKYVFFYTLGMHMGYSNYIDERILKSNWIAAFLPMSLLLSIINSENWIIQTVKGIVITLLMIWFTLWISNKIHIDQIDIIKKISQNGYSIYLLSWPCQVIVEIITNRILKFNVYLVVLLMFIVGVLIPLLIVRIAEKIEKSTSNHLISIIIGGKV